MDELTSRAMAAYFRSEGAAADQPANDSALPSRMAGPMSCCVTCAASSPYRVRTSGALKRLRRWPADIEGF